MSQLQIQLLFFIAQMILLYFVTRACLTRLYQFLSSIISSKRIVYYLVSLIYFPGTFLHEVSHLTMATALLLRVKEIQIFPKITDEGKLKLGHVLFEKRDVIRGVLVGVAPFFAGFSFFWGLNYFNLFPNSNWGLTILFAYLIFAVSSTMFSSRQDLVDILYASPLIIMIIGIIYIFDFTVEFEVLLRQVNIYLFVPLLINTILWIATFWLRR